MDKPLHVQVAEALGCKPGRRSSRPEIGWHCTCPDDRHATEGVDGAPHEGHEIEHYDTDWFATGPLIERYGIGLSVLPVNPRAWWPGFDSVNQSSHDSFGQTPLTAVCNLILELHKSGKLTTTV